MSKPAVRDPTKKKEKETFLNVSPIFFLIVFFKKKKLSATRRVQLASYRVK